MAIFTKQDAVAALGEFVGTTLFLLLALGGAKTAQVTRTASQIITTMPSPLDNQTIQFISLSFGISLLVTAWVFYYRVTGGLFNPAITMALWLIGGVNAIRAGLLVTAQLLGGIAASGLVAALTPNGGVASVETTLGPGVNVALRFIHRGILDLHPSSHSHLSCATEKHKSTYLAPVGIGLTLMTCHLFGVVWTGCGINPARSFGPSVVSGSFPGYHWIYWLGPALGTCTAVAFYKLLKLFDYTAVVFGQDSDHELTEAEKELQEKQAILRRAKSNSTDSGNGNRRKRGPSFLQRRNKKGQMEFVKRVDQKKGSNGNEVMISTDDAMEKGAIETSDGTNNDANQPTMRADHQNTGGLVSPPH